MDNDFEEIHHMSDYRLPASYTREIGRVIVRWAYLEHRVQAIIWTIALRLTRKVERSGDWRLWSNDSLGDWTSCDNHCSPHELRQDAFENRPCKGKRAGGGAQFARPRVLD